MQVLTPTLVAYFVGKPEIQEVKAGDDFCMVLLKNGTLHAMGHKNRCGQDTAAGNFYSPAIVSVGNNAKIASIACCSQASTIVQTVTNEWFAFGSKAQEKPAYGKVATKTATRIDDIFPKQSKIKKLVATMNSFLMLCDDGYLYVIGNRGNGEMGMNEGKDIETWSLSMINVADVQTGLHNSFVFTK